MGKIKYFLIADGFSIFSGWIDFLVILTMASFKFNSNPFEMSILSAAMLLPSILLVSLIGYVSSTKNAINYLLISLFLRSVVGVLIIFSENFVLFCFFVVLRSVFNSFSLPLIQTVTVRSLASEDRSLYYSSLNMINSFSKISAPALGGVIAVYFSYDYSLILASIFTFLSFLMFFKIKKSLLEFEGDCRSGMKAKSLNINVKEVVFWNKILPSIFIFFFFVYMVNNQLPIILKDLNMSESSLGFLISASAVGNFLYGFCSLKFGCNSYIEGGFYKLISSVVMIMLVFMAIGVYIYFDGANVFYLMILFFISGVFSSKFSIFLSVYMSTYLVDSFGYMSSKLQALQNLIILIAPFFGALILVEYGPNLIFLICGALGVICIFLFNFFVKYKIGAEK